MVKHKDIVGTWILVDRGSDDPADAILSRQRYGDAQRGLLIIAADGWMNAALCHGDRPPMTGNPAWHTDAPETERLEAFDTYISYGGRWSLNGDIFTTQVDFSLNPGWVGGEQVRRVELSPEGQMKLHLSRIWPDGRMVNGWVSWRMA